MENEAHQFATELLMSVENVQLIVDNSQFMRYINNNLLQYSFYLDEGKLG